MLIWVRKFLASKVSGDPELLKKAYSVDILRMSHEVSIRKILVHSNIVNTSMVIVWWKNFNVGSLVGLWRSCWWFDIPKPFNGKSWWDWIWSIIFCFKRIDIDCIHWIIIKTDGNQPKKSTKLDSISNNVKTSIVLHGFFVFLCFYSCILFVSCYYDIVCFIDEKKKPRIDGKKDIQRITSESSLIICIYWSWLTVAAKY